MVSWNLERAVELEISPAWRVHEPESRDVMIFCMLYINYCSRNQSGFSCLQRPFVGCHLAAPPHRMSISATHFSTPKKVVHGQPRHQAFSINPIRSNSTTMASTLPIPRAAIHPLRLRLFPQFHSFARRRNLHSTTRLFSSKLDAGLESIQLEKPDKFRPPSHPQRLTGKKKPRMTYGRDLTEEEKEQQDTKQYPYAFPPKQSFMNWFLTNRAIHVWISLVRPPPEPANQTKPTNVTRPRAS
jgi:hypothetical protein